MQAQTAPKPHGPGQPTDAAVEVSRRALLTATGSLVVVGCAGTKWTVKDAPISDGVAEVEVAKHPELVTPGGMVAVRVVGQRKPVLVMRLEGDTFRVMSLRCPHLGCTVRWDNDEQALRCPCHGSRFDDHGRVTKGPAKSSLKTFPSRFAGGAVQFKTS